MDKSFVVVYHNEHNYDNACQEKVIGPLTEEEGKQVLDTLITGLNAGRKPEQGSFALDEEGTYMSLNIEYFDTKTEIWAEMVPVESFDDFRRRMI